MRIITFFCFSVPFLYFGKVVSDSLKVKEIELIIIPIKNQNIGIISSQKLTEKELENMNSFSVADAIRYFSGIQLKDYGGIGGMKTINIRGIGTQHVGVFYDGIPLGNAQNGMVDLGRFSMDNLESISLYNGQKSEIFQSARDFGTAGSIYLKSRTPVFKNNQGINLNIGYRSGSFGLINPSLLLEKQFAENTSGSLNMEYISAHGKYAFRQRVALRNGIIWERKGIRTNGNIDAIRLEAAIFGKIEKGKWNLKTYYYDSERGVPGAITKNHDIFSARQWDRSFFIQGNFEKEIISGYRFLFSTKMSDDYLHYYNDNPEEIPIFIDNIYQQKELYFSTIHQYILKNFWRISFSTDYQINFMKANLDEFAYPVRNSAIIALASQLDLSPFRIQGSVLGTFVRENMKSTEFSSPRFYSEFTPTFFISYHPFRDIGFKWHTFYKRIFRMPTFNDLYYTDIGNPQLKPEFANQYNIGFTYNRDFGNEVLKNINIAMDGYYNQVEDKIIAYPKGQQFRWTMLNLGRVQIKGLDVSTQALWMFNRDLMLSTRFIYTYENAIDVTVSKINSYYRNQIPYIPRNSGSMLFRLTYREYRLNYSFIYTGERYHMRSNIPENYEQPWYTHDVAFSKEFLMKNWKCKLGFEINNFMNQNYSVILNYPMPGRNYRLSVKFSF